MSPEQRSHFRLLRKLEQHPECSQREIAASLEMSLGRTNYVIRALVDKGFIKFENFLKTDKKLSKSAYVLTPAGIRQRIALTQRYIERKRTEYEALEAELDAFRREVPEAFVDRGDLKSGD